MSTRVVITGIGAVTPLGVGAETLHERAVAGLSGLNDENENGLGGKVGRCLDFDVKNPLSRREMRRMDRYTQLAVAAADEAIAQAGWGGGLPCDARRITCYIGTAIGGLDTLETQHLVMHTEGAEEVSPLTVPMMMANAAPAHISMRHGLHGETTAIVTACSSGAQAIIAGVRSILLGEADAAVVGGAEAGTTRFTRAIFNAAGAISPDGNSTPFDEERNGFNLGEGAGILVLESAENARARGAEVLGEIVGYGLSSDAHHITAPNPDGKYAAYALNRALETAGATPEQVSYVNAHGTGTELNDTTEVNVLRQVFGTALEDIPVSSTKSAIGHLFGAAGAVETIAMLQALRHGQAPPTLGLKNLDKRLGRVRISGEPQDLAPGTFSAADGTPKRLGLSNSLGFGGHNVTLAIRA